MDKKILADPIAVKKRENGKVEWSFHAPSYDNRTSRSIPGGNDYGVGYRTPVGKMEASSMESGPIPQTTHCFSPDMIFDAPTGIVKVDKEDKKG
jgi:hypothetical protein